MGKLPGLSSATLDLPLTPLYCALQSGRSQLYVLGTILSMQISFVGFQPIQSSEHMGALGVFGASLKDVEPSRAALMPAVANLLTPRLQHRPRSGLRLCLVA